MILGYLFRCALVEFHKKIKYILAIHELLQHVNILDCINEIIDWVIN